MASLCHTDSAFGILAAVPSVCRLGFRCSCCISSLHLLLPNPKSALHCLVYRRLRIQARSGHTFWPLIDNAQENWKSWVLGNWQLGGGSQRAADLCRPIDCAASWKSRFLEDWELGGSFQLSAYPNEAELMAFLVSETKQTNSISSASDNPHPSAEKNRSFLPTAPHGLHKARYARQVLVFVGRALLIFGIGLSLSTRALARPAASKVNANSAGNLQSSETKDVKAASKNEEKAANDVQQNLEESEKALSENFWNGIPIPEGSRFQRLKTHMDKHPNDARALAVLLRAVLEQRDMLRALALLDRLVEVEPDELEWKFLKAQIQEIIGKLPMAKEGFKELLRLRPLSARALQGLFMVLNQTGEAKTALEYTETALNTAITEKKNVEAGNLRILLGQIYTQKGNFEEAMKQFGTMIDQDPNDFRAYLCQGLLYSLLDEKVKAEEYLEKYRQLCPEDFPSRNDLDDLMLKVRNGDIKDEMSQNTFKKTPKGKTPKPMKKPFISGRSQEQEDDV